MKPSMNTAFYPPGPKPQAPFEMVWMIRRDLPGFLKQTVDFKSTNYYVVVLYKNFKALTKKQ